MTKQGSRSSRSGASRRSSERQVPAWVWLFTGAVLGGFVMFLLHLGDVEPDIPEPEQSAQETPRSEEEQLPRFDFYERLKNLSVTLPEETLPPPDEAAPAETTELILQVASFKNAEDADQLRVQLILLNLEARIEKVTIRNGETWHRVLVGPFESRSYLAKAREVLLSNGHQALVLKRQRGQG